MADSIYEFSDSTDPEKLRARLRRVESSSPYLRRGSAVTSKSSFSTVDAKLLDSDSGIQLANSLVGKTGSVPPAGVSGAFAWIPSDNGGTLYWDGTNTSTRLVIKRADGSNFSVPVGNKPISGLSPNTTYTLYPFWPTNGTCSIGFVIGDVGDPQICFLAPSSDAAAKQNQQDREQLGILTVTTGASGSGSGSPTTSLGGPGDTSIGGGTCVMHGTDIEPLGDGPYRTDLHSQTEWVKIVVECGWSLAATPNHIIYKDKAGQARMDSLMVGDLVITSAGLQKVIALESFKRQCLKEAVHMERGHLFWANGILSHNVKMQMEL